MDLPQEIVDAVIDNLAFDFTTLKSTSLVRKSWTHRSRLRLFHFVPIISLSRLEKWSQAISPDPGGIASYPRVVHLLSVDTPKSWVKPENLEKFHDHFRSFSGVERLVIHGSEIARFDAASTSRYFGNFAATVRSLELRAPVGSQASLLSFICTFPLVDNLTIEFPTITIGGGGNQPDVSCIVAAPAFKGRLKLLDIFQESLLLVDLLCNFPLPFHTISVSSRSDGRLPQLAKLTRKCGKTLRSLHITQRTGATTLGPTGVSLASCAALEQLRLTVTRPSHLVTILGEVFPTLSNTTNLSRITLSTGVGYLDEEEVDMVTWRNLDAVMSEYAEKISGKHKNRRLTLRFRTNEEGAAGEDDKWARELVRQLSMFPKVGNVEYFSNR